MDVRKQAQQALTRIRRFVRTTPVEFSHILSGAGKCRVQLKLENQQLTGSFKLRGATNKLLSLDETERARGVVAASTGNHGMAVACAAEQIRSPVTVFVPAGAASSKLDVIRAYGAEILRHGTDCVQAEVAARQHAVEEGMTYVSPYNDPDVIAGQGTIALELESQLDHIDAILASVGGGGLISGIGGCLKSGGRDVEVIACSPESSPVMHASLQAGRILDLESKPTLSDGTAGGIEAEAITFDLCRKYVDDSILVSEAEIADAIRLIVRHHHMLIEGAAGVAVAAFLKDKRRFENKNVVIVLCGANVDLEVLKQIL